MSKDIMNMTMEELDKYYKEELKKANFQFISLDKEGLPEEFVTAGKYIQDNIYSSSFFKNEKHKLVFVEEYMPMMGMVWRIFIFDILKAKEILDKFTENGQAVNIKRVIGGSLIVSIYYDTSDILGIMNKPYFEIYDRNDVERFWSNEYKELYNCAEDILSRMNH